jgi:NAD+ diphosphatase
MMDNFTRSSHNMYVAQGINRAHNRRRNEDWIFDRLHSRDSYFLAVWQSKLLVTEGDAPRPVLLGREQVLPLMGSEEAFFLGEADGHCYFAAEIDSNDPKGPEHLIQLGQFRDLRGIGPLLSKEDGALLAYAKTLAFWHGQNRFCGVCGSRTRSGEGGQVRICSNTECCAAHFPRTDPAIIVLIRSGEKCLLGRQSGWPELMYSVIAGFVAPGESAEAAVVREVAEETGVVVKNIYYHSSQPWPFPCSLMLGFTAEAETEKILLGDRELEDARWFSRRELREAIERGEVKLPPPISIARHLIADWFEAEGQSYSDYPAVVGEGIVRD